MTTISTTAEQRTYGQWRRPTAPGLGMFGLLGTIVIFVGLLSIIGTVMLAGLLPAAVVAVPFLLVLGLLSAKDVHGRNFGQRLGVKLGWIKTKSSGSQLYRSGPLGRTRWGTFQLPGLAARSELSEATDSYGRTFALLRIPATNHYSIVIEVQPDGSALVDQDQIDVWVAHWGQWLANLATETGVVAAAVTVETAPDSGARLRREVSTNTWQDAPLIAKSMLHQVIQTYPTGSAAIRAWVTLTVKGVDPSGKRRNADEVAAELGSRMPHLTSSLSSTGAGAAYPVDAYDLCEIVRTAYDPAIAPVFDEAHAEGERIDLDWTEVGPTAHEGQWDAYRHDSCWSVSWSMSQAPRGHSLSSSLTQLLAPHRDIARKRVTMLYRPIPSGVAAGIVESDKRNADFAVSGQSRPSSRALNDQAAARSTANEEARGAGLVNFGMVVTATVTEADQLPSAKAAIDSLSAGARIRLRTVYGSQDSAFAASLPLGLVLPDHLKVPAALRAAV